MGVALDARSLELLVEHYGKIIHRTGHAKINVALDANCVDMLTVAFTSKGYLVLLNNNVMTISK